MVGWDICEERFVYRILCICCRRQNKGTATARLAGANVERMNTYFVCVCVW